MLILSTSGCQQEGRSINVMVDYEGSKAVSVHFPYAESTDELQLFLKSETKTPVFGSFERVGDSYRFKPVIPFTSGQTYEIRKKGEVLAEFSIPHSNTTDSTGILKINPIQDTVPENLLKIYVQFSKPMQNVGSALDFITIYNETEKKKESIFLPLETELWNREHDLLTLWLDPGRIKTDLIPNQEQGMPLKAGNQYTLTFDKNWKAADGQAMQKAYKKSWYVTARDAIKPKVEDWKIEVPNSGTKEVLTFHFGESLDYVLAQETITLQNSEGTMVKGDWKVDETGKRIRFIPATPWLQGSYTVIVEAILEDLAGNNLNRLFDENLETSSKTDSQIEVHSLSFQILN